MPKKITPEQPDFENALAASLGEEQPEQIEEQPENPTDNIQDYGFSMPQPSTMDRIGAGLAGLGEGLSAAQAVKGPNTGAMQAGAAFKAAFGMASGLLKERTEALNMALERLPLSDVSPALAKKFPSLAGMPSKMAYETIKSIEATLIKSKSAEELAQKKIDAELPDTATLDYFSSALETPKEALVKTPIKTLWNMLAKKRYASQPVTYQTEEITRGGIKVGERVISNRGKVELKFIPGAVKQSEQIEKINSVLTAINDGYERAKDFDTGRVSGAVQLGLGKIGLAPKSQAFKATIDILRTQIARIVGGEVGNLTETEQKVAQQALPGLMDTPAELEEKQRILNDMITRRISDLMGGVEFGSAKTPSGKPKPTPSNPQNKNRPINPFSKPETK